ncbi:primosomal protein N' [Methylacidimicrobium sp. B4]|uniref:replication restart helicase PriA n=1 Tax=Methylacidimicrobium sp. B4 TaxID=2796139 RepID=UPI001A8D549C|nr:primosomal protein N' [Methylacidimicrobium sp. B4]QSR83962.1 primosomal protein N' [Methylacidimicrobium sp. B4]
MWSLCSRLSSPGFALERADKKIGAGLPAGYDTRSQAMASELFEGQGFRSERRGAIARVLLERKRDCLLDYGVPERLADQIGIGSHVRVPLRGGQATGWVIGFPEKPAVEGLRELAGIPSEPFPLPATLLGLAEWVAGYYCAPLAATLGCLLPAPVRRAQAREQLRVSCLPQQEEELDRLGCSPREKQAWMRLHALGPTWLSELCTGTGIGPQVWKRLAKRKLVDLQKAERPRHPLRDLLPERAVLPVLTEEQAAAFEEVRTAIRESGFAPYLLFGVTGSGKTEVYLRCAAEALAHDRSALILVPEIALTPQLVEQVQRRFGDLPGRVALWHSRLSAGERHDQWRDVCSGRSRIVVGARSAIFCPLRDLGLIVVDEEHEPAYKQGETPRYHARDVAVMRARREGIPVLLGSACPSLESYANALAGKYRLLELSRRVEDRSLPWVRIVDLRGRGRRRKAAPAGAASESPWLSRELREELGKRLARREQSILYVNRRGYARVLQCAGCGAVRECPHCSVALTYHRAGETLRCHFCGHFEPYPQACSVCGGAGFDRLGLGTERVVEAVEEAFPTARILRMDSDSMARKGSLAEALRAFAERGFDLLVGTQMVAKGLHFPGVTLVGVVQIDGLLHMPDFRSAERAFQQLLQVAGRSGRGEERGVVLIQTRCPVHPAIQFARHHDYRGFAEQDLEFRTSLGYPPAVRLVLLVWKSPNEGLCRQAAEVEAEEIRRRLAGVAEAGEILPAPIARLQGAFRYQLLLKTARIAAATRLLKRWTEERGRRTDVDLVVDVDPVEFL